MFRALAACMLVSIWQSIFVMSHGATGSPPHHGPLLMGACLGLALLMVGASFARQGWISPKDAIIDGQPAGTVALRSMAGALRQEAFIETDQAYFADEPIVAVTDRVAVGVRDTLAKTGEADRFAMQLHASWDHGIKAIARATDDPDDLRFALRPYFTAWMDDYIWLLRHAEKLGFRFASLDDPQALAASRSEPLLFLRYDIHVRDIAPFYGILDANRSLDVPSVAYLQWSYSDVEERAADDFLALHKFQSPTTRFGLHVSPIPTLLSAQYGGYKPYFTALRDDGLMVLGDNLERSFSDVTGWTSPALPQRARRVVEETITAFRQHFSEFRSISLHGSEFDNAVRRYCADRQEACELKPLLVHALFSTDGFDELGASIIDEVVDDYGLKTATDSTPARTVVCSLQQAAIAEESLVLLLHPAQFMRGRRAYRDLAAGHEGPIDCAEPS